MSCLDNSLYLPEGGCGDCELDKDSILASLGYSEIATVQTLPDGGGEVDRIIIGRKLSAYPVSLTITSPPSKTTYTQYEEFEPWGMVVTATYSDGTTKTVTDYTVSADTSQVGTQTYTVGYTDLGIEVFGTGTITVIQISHTVLRLKNGVYSLIINETVDNQAWNTTTFGAIDTDYGHLYHDSPILWQNEMSSINYVYCDERTEVDTLFEFFRGADLSQGVFLENLVLTGDSAEGMFRETNVRIAFSNLIYWFDCDHPYIADWMFCDCTALEEFSNMWDNPKCYIKSAYHMFDGCTSMFTCSINGDELVKVAKMFEGCTALYMVRIDNLGEAYVPGMMLPNLYLALSDSPLLQPSPLGPSLETFGNVVLKGFMPAYYPHISLPSSVVTALNSAYPDLIPDLYDKGWVVDSV